MRTFLAAILAIYVGVFTIIIGCFVALIPIMLVFWGSEQLPLGPGFVIFAESLKRIIMMVLLFWLLVCFIVPAMFDTVRVSHGISIGRQPPNPYDARDKVIARFAGLGRDIGRAWGLLRKVRKLFHA